MKRRLQPISRRALPPMTSLSQDRSQWEFEYEPEEEQDAYEPAPRRPMNIVRQQEERGLDLLIDGLQDIKQAQVNQEQREAVLYSEFTDEQLVKMRRGRKIPLSRRQRQHLTQQGWKCQPYPSSESCFWHYTFTLQDGFIFTETEVWQKPGIGATVESLQDTAQTLMGFGKVFFGARGFLKAGREHALGE